MQDVASKQAQKFNQAKSSPKDKEGNVRLFHDWSLDSLINVAHEVELLSLDIKKYGHTLKDFRNYIHPRQQASQGFKPDQHTAKISWQVLQAAIASLIRAEKMTKLTESAIELFAIEQFEQLGYQYPFTGPTITRL